jgi:hypothetical protein
MPEPIVMKVGMYEGKSVSIRTRVLMFCELAVLLSVHTCQKMAPLTPLVKGFSIITQISFAL